jgi:membrane fusion protein, copper/silver efflux system
VRREFVAREIRMVGKIAADETRVRDVVVLTDGVIEKLFVNYVGVPVAEGEHLAELYSPEVLAASKELLVASDAARASGNAEILQSSRRKLTLLGVSEAGIEGIISNGVAPRTFTLYSPIGGVLTSMGGHQGHWLNRGEHLGEITDLSTVWAVLDAYESDVALVHYGQPVNLEVEAFPGRAFRGFVAFIDPKLDESTRTVKIRLNVPNTDGALRPGMFVRARLEARVTQGGKVIAPELAGKWISPMHPEIVKDGPGSCDICGMPLVPAESLGFVQAENTGEEAPLVIPATAPLITGARAVVYVELEAGRYEGREITLGPRAGDRYVVLAGLRDGERVVVNGAFKLDSTLQIQAKPSMMSPEGSGAPAAAPMHQHGGR